MNNAPQLQTPGPRVQPPPAVLSGQNPASGNDSISTLAPKILKDSDDLAKVQPYLDTLKATIDEPGITNIALTGGYGSGKSTIINTFQSQHGEYSYLRISLASFGDVKKVAEAGVAPSSTAAREKKEELERLLEVSILQQIFYHVKPSQIPDSRFKRINNITNNWIIGFSFALILWICSGVFLFKFGYINKMDPASWDHKLPLSFTAVIVIPIFFAGIAVFTKKIIRLLGNSKINKVNIKGELELGDKLDKSVFNEHLEEILYFFERTTFNLVVIEDLDRFDTTEIFTKLRELNTLLNNSASIKERKGHKEIVFLYAIRDEIFTDKNERVKFFEYIIPVIPFINPSNAGEQLTRLINRAGVQNVLTPEFTQDVVTFIDDIDMRLLTNIFHEYQLYRASLGPGLSQDNLFAMIIYKNMFPEDFGKLHSRKGNLYAFISGRETYLAALKNEIEAKINKKATQMEQIIAAIPYSESELRSIYINALYKLIPNASAVHLGIRVSFAELNSDEHFEQLMLQDKINYYYYQVQNSYSSYTLDREFQSNSGKSFEDLEKLVDDAFGYHEKLQQISDQENGKLEELKQEALELGRKKLELDAISLAEIFKQVEIDSHLSIFSDNGLMRNLLLNGYINESYHDYISLFHEVNLTLEDFIFEKNIKSGKNSPFDYKLDRIGNLVRKLPPKYFQREAILNSDLLAFMLQDTSLYADHLKLFFEQLAGQKKRSIEFIADFIQSRPEAQTQFIRLLLSKWSGMWKFLLSESGYPKETLRKYLQLCCLYGDLEDLKLQGSQLSSYISTTADFFEGFDGDEQTAKAKTVISGLNISFAKLQVPDAHSAELFDFVYQNGYYKLSAENVLLIVEQKYTADPAELPDRSYSYTDIVDSNMDPLIDRIQGDINGYVKEVLLKIPVGDESEDYMISLLNNESLHDELKNSIIKHIPMTISDIAQINELHIQQLIIQQHSIKPSWENLSVYLDEISDGETLADLDDILIAYLNTSEIFELLSLKKIAAMSGRNAEYKKSLSLRLIYNNALQIDAYSKLMTATPYQWDSLAFEGLFRDKVEWMVKTNFLNLTASNYDKLKSNFPKLHINLVFNHQDELEDKITEIDLDDEDKAYLLSSPRMEYVSKLLIVKSIDESILQTDGNLARLSCEVLAGGEKIPLSFTTLSNMFVHNTSNEQRIQLLNMYLDDLDDIKVRTLIESLNGSYPDLFKRRHRPKFKNTTYHTTLFQALKSKGLLHDFKTIDDLKGLKVQANY